MVNQVAATETVGTGENGTHHAAEVLFGGLVHKWLDAALPGIEDRALQVVTDTANRRLNEIPALKIEVYINDQNVATLNRQHYMFPVMIHLLLARDRMQHPLNIALFGAPGNGKTCMAMNAAKALKLDYVLQPFNPSMTKADILGYMDANGRYVATPFYQAYCEGRLYIADEFDAANPGLAVILNAAVSNRVITFPNGETRSAHDKFRALFIMNTNGLGADDRHTGRNRLDASTLDRVVPLLVQIDPGLEASLVGIPDVKSPEVDIASGGRYADEREILHRIICMRGIIEKERMRYVLSPRATIHACAMHDAGFGHDFIDACCLWRGMSEVDKAKLEKLLTKAS